MFIFIMYIFTHIDQCSVEFGEHSTLPSVYSSAGALSLQNTTQQYQVLEQHDTIFGEQAPEKRKLWLNTKWSLWNSC